MISHKTLATPISPLGPACLNRPLSRDMGLSWRQVTRYGQGLNHWQTYLEKRRVPGLRILGVYGALMEFASFPLRSENMYLALGAATIGLLLLTYAGMEWTLAQRHLRQISLRRNELMTFFDPHAKREPVTLKDWKPRYYLPPTIWGLRNFLGLFSLLGLINLMIGSSFPGIQDTQQIFFSKALFIAAFGSAAALELGLFLTDMHSPLLDKETLPKKS